MARTISDADRARAARPRARSGRTISDADRRLIEALLNESGRAISDADRARAMEMYINRNDGGIAKKARVF